MRTQFLFATLLTATGLTATVANAQQIATASAGLVHHTEGVVRVNGEVLQTTGDRFISMKQGDTLSTEIGRAEILLNAGTFLRLGESSSFKLASSDLAKTELTLLSGSAIIEVADLPEGTSATLELMGSSIALQKRGLYEFEANAPGRVRVHDGELKLTSPGATSIKVGKGREIAFNALLAGPVKFDQKLTSALYNWGSRRAIYIAQVNQSAARTAWIDQSNGYGTGYSSLGPLSALGAYRGMWVFNPMFGVYTYLPLSGYGYSPYGIQIFSPRTIMVVQPSFAGAANPGGFSNNSPAYASSSTSVNAPVSLPASTAPAAASPNTGGGGEAGRRR
jgi:hypothetical protein